MSQPKYTLTYFNGRGRAEGIRWLFAAAQVEYEDKRVNMPGNTDPNKDWAKLKQSAPFGVLPMLEETEENIRIGQSIAISMFLANRFGLAGKNEVEKTHSHMMLQCVSDMQDVMMKLMFGEEKAKEDAKIKWEGGQRDEYLAKFEKFLDENKSGFFVGNSMTVADIGFVCLSSLMENPMSNFKFETCEFSKVAALVKNVLDSPGIKEWLNKRPDTKF